jgi:hypothetical protein
MPVKLSSSDLKYTYSKFAVNGSGSPFKGKPDSTLFNRHEEFEILPMIEKVMNDLGFVDGADVHIIEDIIHTKMPANTNSRAEVYDWLIRELKLSS